MGPFNRSPAGDAGRGLGTEVATKPPDILPRSHPEDRNEGNLNPDPVLACGIDGPCSHSPSGDPADDDGAGNPSPRDAIESYGQEDADLFDLGAR